MYYKGTIVRIRQCAGCIEVIVEGESPGVFIIDNCMVWPLLDPDGPGLVGQRVEYEAGMMRFLGDEDAQVQDPAPMIPFPHSTCSHNHI